MFGRIWYRSLIRCGVESKGSCGLVGGLVILPDVLDWYAADTQFEF